MAGGNKPVIRLIAPLSLVRELKKYNKLNDILPILESNNYLKYSFLSAKEIEETDPDFVNVLNYIQNNHILTNEEIEQILNNSQEKKV